MRRNYRIELAVSKEELELIKSKSQKLGLSISSFIRLILLNSQIREFEVKVNGKRKV